MRDVGGQVFRRPVLMIGFSHQPADLTPDIGQGRELIHLFAPRVQHLRLDGGFPQMIENKQYIRAPPHQYSHRWKLPVPNAQIKREAIC